MSSPYECPNCATTETKLVLSFANLVRMSFSFALGLLVLVITEGEGLGNLCRLTRKCCECGTRFRESGEARRLRKKLDVCKRCKYSLIGNLSGVCPECGWKLTRAQKRFVRKRGTAGQSKAGDANE